MRRLTFAILLPALLLVAVACGGDDDDDEPSDNGGSTPGSTETTAASGPPLSDLDYLAVICRNLDHYSDAVDTASSADELSLAIDDWIADMAAAVPPEDLEGFHSDFLDYLQSAVDDPTRPLVTEPPLPPDDVRDRLARREVEVDECRDPTFFNQGGGDDTDDEGINP